jgi:anaerobic ribonucleoside-triphosphate reductase activating protein
LYYAGLKKFDIANGPGVRVSLFISGCRRGCKGCFNPETWNFKYGKEFDIVTLLELDAAMDDPNVAGLSILGGDPMEPENIEMVEAICRFVKWQHPEKTIWLWTGLMWDDICELPVMQYIDVLVDGPFVQELKDLRLKWRGSSNQRVINVQESLRSGEVVIYSE